LGFCFGEPSCEMAALWPDSSMEANLLHTLTQPQMELYFGFRTQYKSNLYWRF
jgi:hypothetical protein